MRNVQIIRKKSFLGAWIPYFIFVGYPKTKTDPLDPDDRWDFPESSDIKISNGQTITISVQDGECSIVVWAQTSTGAAGGPAYYIEKGTTDIVLELVTQYSWLDGSRYVLRPAEAKP
jgi:hypothetical protein